MVRTLEEYEAWCAFMEKRKAQIKELYLQGKSQHYIARIIGLSQPGVRKHLVRMRLLIPKGTPDNQAPLPITLKEGDYIRILSGWRPWAESVEIGRCERCQGFFIRRYPAQRYCCNGCGDSKPCTCGTCKRGKIVIS